MAQRHPDLPKRVSATLLDKATIFQQLAEIDRDGEARTRVLEMENSFRNKIDNHLDALPTKDAAFSKFNTSPFVLMFYSRQNGYAGIEQIEKDIVPAKVFSSMETSAGRMVEEVVLPVYGWEIVPSVMHSAESLLDGKKCDPDEYYAVTLKSGPRCLNDEMAQNIGQDIVKNAKAWADAHGTNSVEFTYGVLYGTKKLSNKKDWHVLRNAAEAVDADGHILVPHKDNWSLRYVKDGIEVEATVRIGLDWWEYLGNRNTWIEVCIALIRACVVVRESPHPDRRFVISDMADIVDHSFLDKNYNVGILQRSQFEWLLFLARHFCDDFGKIA
ncbi:PmeII family type II restriction endonuclease [Parasphingorhabdus sp. DH2-15]|uniref:PmeII family type II restriction endonuclease n=1 Tax=Parasphingorhabdus sp. DH2-15 TaxID=3444112 RepID=UPI003F6838DF